MIKLIDLTKIYNSGETVGIGIHNINLEFNIGEFIAIVGSSGSGKTTLLNIVSGMDVYTEGDMLINGESTSNYDAEELENYRRGNVAFIFQNYNLIDSYTVLENVMVELLIKGYSKKDAKSKAIKLLEKVGMQTRLKNRASNLSGGEKQRVVIARALASDAKILACDEPTGNLDEKNTAEIMALIKEVATDKLVLFVTHDESLIKENATRVIKIRDGIIESDTKLVDIKPINFVPSNASKNTFSTKLFITLKNIFRTPKKTSFVFLVFLIVTFSILFSIAYIPLNMMATDNYTIEINMFENRDPNRIVVYPNDSFDNNYQLDNAKVFEKDYLLEYNFQGYSTNISLNDILNAESKLVYNAKDITLNYGRLPNNDTVNSNEIVIITDRVYEDKFYDKILEKDTFIRFRTNNTNGSYFSLDYKIVGFATMENKDEGKTYYYLNDSCVSSFYTSLDKYLVSQKDCSQFINDFSLKTSDKNYSVKINNYIPKNEIIMSFKYRNDDYKLMLGNKTIDLSKYNITYQYITDNTYAIEMSYDTAYDMLSDSKYRVSIISDSETLQSNIDKLRSNDNLQVYPMSEAKIDIPIYNYSSIFKNLFSFVFIIIEIVASIFIVSLITSFILSTKKKEIGVLRVIGLSKNDVLQILYFEVVTLMILSIILNIFVAAIIKCFNPSFAYAIIFNNPIKLIISILILLVMAIFIAYRWNKSMFKLTAREVLKAGE